VLDFADDNDDDGACILAHLHIDGDAVEGYGLGMQ